jgi:hypothetical protein
MTAVAEFQGAEMQKQRETTMNRIRNATATMALFGLLLAACPPEDQKNDASTQPGSDASTAADASSDAAGWDGTVAECETSADCDAESTTRGTICVDGSCAICQGNNQCANDAYYGQYATCNAGRCNNCPVGTEGCDCRTGNTCSGALECVSGTCIACARGDNGCLCLNNGSCNAQFDCLNDVCVPCTPGRVECACSNGSCDPGLDCNSGNCVPHSCVAGTVGCPCSSGACNSGLYCNSSQICATCSNDVVGCACAASACSGGLVCDSAQTTCRRPLTCSQITCAANQRCDEPAGVDASCLQDCGAGYEWNGASSNCVAVHPNCRPGAEQSVLAVCEALNMTCVESATFATCDG